MERSFLQAAFFAKNTDRRPDAPLILRSAGGRRQKGVARALSRRQEQKQALDSAASGPQNDAAAMLVENDAYHSRFAESSTEHRSYPSTTSTRRPRNA
ncbi:MAG TPA: hypothetical protein VGN42_12705 [Pirellulales bacterium]|jgi:hypothetical protein|nr:hypothetical protein [Pirellulales bacterium]